MDAKTRAMAAIDEATKVFVAGQVDVMLALGNAKLSQRSYRRFRGCCDGTVVEDFTRVAEQVKAAIREHGAPDQQGPVGRMLYKRAATAMVNLILTQQEMLALLKQAPGVMAD